MSGWRRRDVLGLLVAVAAAPWLGCSDSPAPSPDGPAHLRLIADAVRAADPSLEADSALVELGLDGERPTGDAGWARLAGSLRGRVHEDFAEGRTVVADGWLLARTEALLAVAAAAAVVPTPVSRPAATAPRARRARGVRERMPPLCRPEQPSRGRQISALRHVRRQGGAGR